MRIGRSLATLLLLSLQSACCTISPAPAIPAPVPARTYLALPAVHDMEGVVRWLELQRTVAVKVDGLDPNSAEVRELDARILAATEYQVAEELEDFKAELKVLIEEQGFGTHNQKVVELKRAIVAAEARLHRARERLSPKP